MRSQPCYSILDFGAIGDGSTLSTAAIQSALDTCRRAGGGTVLIPCGKFVTGALFLHDDITLYMDAGSVLLGSENPDDYPIVDSRWEGRGRQTYAPLITGSGLNRIAITGRGVIDGRGASWWIKHRDKTLRYPRPRLISFVNCHNVLVEGVTLTNSPSWTINPILCENVTVDKVTILNPPDSPNTDGINPDSCRNVHISNCHVDVGDDCIAIKSGIEVADRSTLSPCENIAITNCTMVHGHGGVVIGSEMSGNVRHVVVSNCVFIGTDRGIRLKSRRGRGGIVEDVRVTNVSMEDVLCPFTMNLYYHIGVKGNKEVSDKRPHPVDKGTPHFRGIHFSHITAHNAQYAAAFLYGLPEMPVENVSFDNVSVSLASNAHPGEPDMADDVEPMARAGFFARNARGLRLCNVEVIGHSGPALRLLDVQDVEISASGTRTPAANSPVIELINARGVFVHGSDAPPGTDTFLFVEGESTQAVALSGNNLVRAKRSVALGKTVPPDALAVV
ncbi:MAG TPA: glycoside hydrolase family 28 protein [Anaerolineae bacterium]